MRFKISLVFLLIIYFNSFGQKEVFFNDLNPDKKKVETLHGIELNVNPNFYLNKKSYDIPPSLGLGYFYEKAIGKSVTLKLSTDLEAYYSDIYTYTESSIFNSSNYTISKGYTLLGHLVIEPRWYFTFSKRYDQGHSRLNSGWFLGFPIVAERDFRYKTDRLSVMPIVGFRQSLTTHLFLECSAGAGYFWYLKHLDFKPEFDHSLKASISYAF